VYTDQTMCLFEFGSAALRIARLQELFEQSLVWKLSPRM
jgi:hypothetical protein